MAYAAARTKGTYLSAFYQRLAVGRRRNRAIMVVAHAIVVSAFHMLSRNEPYHDLGANYIDEQRRHHHVERFRRRLGRRG